jgi:hypothetical protein
MKGRTPPQMNEDNQNNEEKTPPHETFDEFCQRLGIRTIKREGRPGVQSVPWREPFAQEAEAGFRPATTEMNEDKNEAEKPARETLEEFCKRLGIKFNTRQRQQGGVEFSPYHGGHLSANKRNRN